MANTGRCLCGNIQYELLSAPVVTGVCHCKNCQRQAGSAFSTLAGVPMADFKVAGEPTLYVDGDTGSGNPVHRFFCNQCGSPIYSCVADSPDMAYVKTGTLDDTADFTVMFHCWCSTKQAWVALDDAVPAFAENPS